MQQLQEFNSSRFNALLEIEKADADVRDCDELSVAFTNLGPIFVKHGVHDSWGLSLLHKHWSVTPQELPIQDIIKSDSPMEFEVRPRKAFAKAFSPSILAVSNNDHSELEPLEFSTDMSAADANNILALKPAFLREFASATLRHKLEQKFGLIALKETTSGYDLVEFNFVEPLSIVRETRPQEIRDQQVIETSWRFAPDVVGGTCTKSCFSRCTIPSGGGSHQHDHTAVHAPSE